ncbi:MAG: hypothetical protein ABR607_10685 [Pyrinomonadaceae bacterium]
MKRISCLLSLLLLLTPVGPALAAGQKTNNVDHIKREVAKLGVGSKAKATITLHNDTKVKGYVYSAGDEEFVIRDRRTDAPTTIRYADVYKVDDARGHSIARNAMIIVAAGAAITLVAIFAAIARNER